MRVLRVLLLGGTTEASQIGRELAAAGIAESTPMLVAPRRRLRNPCRRGLAVLAASMGSPNISATKKSPM